MERKTPPQGYICHRCKVAGMFTFLIIAERKRTNFFSFVVLVVLLCFVLWLYITNFVKLSYLGHFIQHCPTNGDPTFDIKRVKPPTGIPKSMLMATPDGSYALPSGAVAVLKPNE